MSKKGARGQCGAALQGRRSPALPDRAPSLPFAKGTGKARTLPRQG
ncbi:hypothetical protein DESPIG_02216 [Desulfovibrio piger ATCC 29098]|uniref:Uncharacterized protein n=1 Tax=Desulfovibrio piger ATCC 29098 TaxID=411464 RepID=B6WVU8_9BACT|nr:hypothetical protein DESPIG_02216 [Desulfovibrio piger ATCC 29098]